MNKRQEVIEDNLRQAIINDIRKLINAARSKGKDKYLPGLELSTACIRDAEVDDYIRLLSHEQ